MLSVTFPRREEEGDGRAPSGVVAVVAGRKPWPLPPEGQGRLPLGNPHGGTPNQPADVFVVRVKTPTKTNGE